MKVGELPGAELRGLLAHAGIRVRTGPFVVHLRSTVDALAEDFSLQYAAHPVEPESAFADFSIRIANAAGIRRLIRPQVLFEFEGARPFDPLPAHHAFPMLEWGLNWCVSSHYHRLLVVHAASVERGGRAIILPAQSGSGKSTLCAALVAKGWRLLSDELTLIDTQTGQLHALARPIGLKRESIELIRHFDPSVRLGNVVPDTSKGAVAHMVPPASSVSRMEEAVTARWILLPRFEPGSAARLEPASNALAFMRLVENAVNYDLHGRAGFECLANIVEGSTCNHVVTSHLDAAVALVDELVSSAG